VKEPKFLSVDQVKILHNRSLQAYGGLDGIREPSLFESAVFQPQNVFYYQNGDLFDIASAYAFHIAQAQACFDGNKRTGIASALVFLEMNGISSDYEEDMLYDVMIDVAERKLTREDFADLLRNHKK
jgi:death-on-curing protein|tara:strand:+ start:348 stop:728 length:381 start_codon:yes stop_codon:yes gene_type:complete